MNDLYQFLDALSRVARENGFVWDVPMNGGTRTVRSWSENFQIGAAEERLLRMANANRLVVSRPLEGDTILTLTDYGIQTMLRQNDSNHELVDWVRRSRAALDDVGLHIESTSSLYNEVDRIERSLHFHLYDTPNQHKNDIYQHVAAALHNFLIDEKGTAFLSAASKAPLGKKRRQALKLSLSDVYLGKGGLYHAFDNTLPPSPNDIHWMKNSGSENFGKVLLATGAFGLSSPRPGLVAMTTDRLINRDEWLAQNLLCVKDEIQSTRTIIDNVRNTVASHVLPFDEARQSIDRLASSMWYGEMHGASTYVCILARYVLGLLRVFRLGRHPA